MHCLALEGSSLLEITSWKESMEGVREGQAQWPSRASNHTSTGTLQAWLGGLGADERVHVHYV